DRFVTVLETELQKEHNLQELEALLVDLLEEIKVNYVRKISEGEMLNIVEEAERLHRKVKD
ncbi:MAG: hypothetical protein ACFCU5_03895, partial [Pleurocapsa sp.]